MGNQLMCMPKTDERDVVRSRSKRSGRASQRNFTLDEELLHRQAISMALQQHQISQRFEGSMSRRVGSTSSRPVGSTSSRRKSSIDTLPNGKPVSEALENIKTKKFVLVHGEGFGAWCWYKSIPLLEEAGLFPVAIDLTGSGIEHTDPNSISALADYSKPLIDYLNNLDNEKVILVGHSCGGASISYALENCPEKISKAVFLCATMVLDGQKPFDVFAEELACAEIFTQESKYLSYGNGKEKPPTSLKLDKDQIKTLYFNQSPSKDVALAMLSMRPIPLVPIMEKLSLSSENYGKVQRYFVQTLEDRTLSPDIQEKLVRDNPPSGVFKIKGSDHCPFFSKPQTLHKILLEIAQTP